MPGGRRAVGDRHRRAGRCPSGRCVSAACAQIIEGARERARAPRVVAAIFRPGYIANTWRNRSSPSSGSTTRPISSNRTASSLREKGFEVDTATNADDAVEMLRRRPFGIVLLDEQMPGKRGLEALREIRELDPLLPIVMVTKSEEDATLREAIGADVRDYLVKPINPRQVLTVDHAPARGRRASGSRRVARRSSSASASSRLEPVARLDWRGWIARWYASSCSGTSTSPPRTRQSLYDSLQGLYPALRARVRRLHARRVPALAARSSRATVRRSRSTSSPSSSLPILERSRAAVFIVIDCLRLDQWRVLEPLLAPLFDVETTHYFSRAPDGDAVLAQRALQRALSRRDRRALPRLVGRARGRVAQRARARAARGAARGAQDRSAGALRQDLLERRRRRPRAPRLAARSRTRASSAFVFNFVDLLTHGRSESAILYEVARDEIALRALTQQWFERSVLFAAAQGGGAPHGSRCSSRAITARSTATRRPRCSPSATRRRICATSSARTCAPSVRSRRCCSRTRMISRLPRRGLGANTLLAMGDTFFVYPTKLREYQRRYRGSFLHGGVTPEECILPVALLTPQALSAGRRSSIRGSSRSSARTRWRMAGNIVFNLIAAALDGFSFTLLIPFLNALFQQPSLPVRSRLGERLPASRRIGALLDPAHPMGSLRQRHPDHPGHRRGQERLRLARRAARRVAAGVRDARPARRACTGTCSGCRSATSRARRSGRSSRASSPTPSRRRRSSPSS